jgi:hypothetical protein
LHTFQGRQLGILPLLALFLIGACFCCAQACRMISYIDKLHKNKYCKEGDEQWLK